MYAGPIGHRSQAAMIACQGGAFAVSAARSTQAPGVWPAVLPTTHTAPTSPIRPRKLSKQTTTRIQVSRQTQRRTAAQSVAAQTANTLTEDGTPLAAPSTAQSAASNGGGPFSWTRAWWPLLPLAYLDPSRPKAVTVMGVQVVVWRDGQGQWRCFKDACPHRLAPLSEGRVEADGTLMCAYHAWRFDGEGKCTTIPQATSSEAEATAKASKRSCATAFPVQEHVGLLWVWPDDAPTRWIDSAASSPVIPNMLQHHYKEQGNKLDWFMRELPYGYEVLLENVIDPAHVPVSHHGVLPGCTRYKIVPIDLDKDPQPVPANSLLATGVQPTVSVLHTSVLNRDVKDRILQFTVPAHVQYGNPEGTMSTQLYCIPVGPGRSRVMHKALGAVPGGEPKNFGEVVVRAVLRLVWPLVLGMMSNHRTWLSLFDGDGVFLNMQEANLRSSQHGGDWRRAYFMPATCDRVVLAARRWLDSVGAPFPEESSAAQAEAPIERRTLLDRYSQHTAHCPKCQADVKRLEALAGVAKAVAAAAFLATCAVLGTAGLHGGLLTGAAPYVTQAGATAALLLGVAVWCAAAWLPLIEAARREFFFTDYVHADKN